MYLRVSTEGQAEAFGLDAQRAAIRRYCEDNGHEIVSEAVDPGVSGTVELSERPGLACALDAIQDGDADGLIVARLDRLARQLTVQEAILSTVWKHGADVFTADAGEVLRDDPDDPLRKALRQIIGVIAELERGMISKRMADGKRVKRAAGGKAEGRYPYGWSKQGPIHEEQNVLAMVRALRDGGQTWSTVARELNNRAWCNRAGRPWTVAALSKTAAKAGIR
jgi:DNA invertase Pin-like site-specific DNA recombinase